MLRILITGATGNVGRAMLTALPRRADLDIWAGVRDVARGAAALAAYPHARPVPFDFANPAGQEAALAGCDSVFLLRPPQLTDDFSDFIARAGRAVIGYPNKPDGPARWPIRSLQQRLCFSGDRALSGRAGGANNRLGQRVGCQRHFLVALQFFDGEFRKPAGELLHGAGHGFLQLFGMALIQAAEVELQAFS